jgi:hypothetical protein
MKCGWLLFGEKLANDDYCYCLPWFYWSLYNYFINFYLGSKCMLTCCFLHSFTKPVETYNISKNITNFYNWLNCWYPYIFLLTFKLINNKNTTKWKYLNLCIFFLFFRLLLMLILLSCWNHCLYTLYAY